MKNKFRLREQIWNNLKVMNKTKKEKKAHNHGQKQGFVHHSENLQNPQNEQLKIS